jgi:crotonobetainyl-CoA:carnitine CoA-transferase CaiB-like acyl-CoA transferase
MKPLEGLLVLAFEQAVAAPVCTSRLADAGARVIKVERPEGDFSRGYDKVVRGESAYFVWCNRGKQSAVLDIKSPEDSALIHRILAKADVFVQNLAPGAAARAGYDAEELRRTYPRLIVCDISGYGEDGPYRDMRAYDLMVQAESGLASITGTHHAPGRVGVSACDIGTGMFAHAKILEALIRRGRTGEGSAISVSLFGAMADWMGVPLLHHDSGAKPWPRIGLGHPLIAPYGAYPVKDGGLLMIAVQNDREWQRLAREVLNRNDLADRDDLKRNMDRVNFRAELDAAIAGVFAAETRAALVARIKAADIAFANVNEVKDLAEHPQLKRITVGSPAGPILIVAPAASYRGEPVELGPVPGLGEHTALVRRDFR